MKRFLAFFVALLLAFSTVGVCFSAFAAEIGGTNELGNFTDALLELVRTYDAPAYAPEQGEAAAETELKQKLPMTYDKDFFSPHEFAASHYDAVANDGDEEMPDSTFASKRLIVKSEKKIPTQGAVECISGYRDLHILQYETENAARNALAYYKSCPDVIYAEPDYICSAEGDWSILSAQSNDTRLTVHDQALSYVSDQIGFESIKDTLAGMQLSQIAVAQLDSGVDLDHELLKDRLLPNNVNFSGTGEPDSCEDDYGHGTHVAGILADNSSSNVKIRPYKVLNRDGKGPMSLIALAVDKAVEDGASIINMSLSSKGESQTMTDSVNNAVAKNINVVVAAGNDCADLEKTYYSPACVESAITVSATTQSNRLSAYSNYNNTIDIAAPGDNVKSSYLNNSYTLMSGTSMAAPLVSAGLAILRTAFPGKTAADAEATIKKFAIQVPRNEKINEFGSGILFLKYILQSQPKTADPVFSAEEGVFAESFDLSLSCPEADATILYVLNSSEALPQIGFQNGTVYKTPFTVSIDTKVSAIAISKGKLPSAVVTKTYTRAKDSEEDLYDINKSGNITAYLGTQTDIVIPDTVHGTAVRGIAARAFRGNTFLRSVTLPDTVTTIGTSAFADCTALQSVKGAGVRQISSAAFQNSAVSACAFPNVTSIGTKVFSGCRNLAEVDFPKIDTVDAYAFENTAVRDFSSDTLQRIGMFAFRGSAIETVSLPRLTTLSASAFANCASLRSFSAPRLATVSISAFENCIALQTAELPEVVSVALNSFKNTGLRLAYLPKLQTVDRAAFSGSTALEAVLLPEAVDVNTSVFENCTRLNLVYLPKLTTLKRSVFDGCRTLTFLSLPAVETVNAGAFSDTTLGIKFLQLDSVCKIESLPATVEHLVLPTSFTQISCTLPQTDFTVYGNPNTYAQKFAADAKATFKEVPVIVFNAPEKYTPEDKILAVYAVGFHCKYQWYKSDSPETVGAPIDGADDFWYTPVREDNTAYYYCVIESNDGTNTASVTTHAIENAPELRDADFTAYTAAVEQANAVDRSQHSDASLAVLDAALAVDVQGLSLAEQDTVDAQTQAILQAIAALQPRYILGDVNGDGMINAVDARWTLQAASGVRALDDTQALAADANLDNRVTAVDARWILQAASGIRTLSS